ncbi:hypothetical protein CDAR_169971 [Caerostris darwini]|uniref:Uncharacterized protein n=1 Tax=Caerostris darwini TaxID=1538125 RepID=A0AAV4RWI5_9ARAC|nr:hypothetical protein CDAR_169971 [Caerostris darwini]
MKSCTPYNLKLYVGQQYLPSNGRTICSPQVFVHQKNLNEEVNSLPIPSMHRIRTVPALLIALSDATAAATLWACAGRDATADVIIDGPADVVTSSR